MPGLIRGVARTAVVAGTATAVSNRVSRRQAGRWAGQEEQAAYAAPPQQYAAPPPQYPPPQQYAEPAPAEPPPPAPEAPAAEASAADDMSQKLAMLQQLAGLKAQGILTEEEFEAQKAKLLAS
jgi:Short C-terminal domain